MDKATINASTMPGLDETGALLAEVNIFLKKSRERTAAIAVPPRAAEPENESRGLLETLKPIEPNEIHKLHEIRKPKDKPEAAAITQRQLRALSRKHLFIMIRDLEKELVQAKEEKADMLLAYQAGRRL